MTQKLTNANNAENKSSTSLLSTKTQFIAFIAQRQSTKSTKFTTKSTKFTTKFHKKSFNLVANSLPKFTASKNNKKKTNNLFISLPKTQCSLIMRIFVTEILLDHTIVPIAKFTKAIQRYEKIPNNKLSKILSQILSKGLAFQQPLKFWANIPQWNTQVKLKKSFINKFWWGLRILSGMRRKKNWSR